jgi:hypothetical protein
MYGESSKNIFDWKPIDCKFCKHRSVQIWHNQFGIRFMDHGNWFPIDIIKLPDI